MTSQEIYENNELIANFMSLKPEKDWENTITPYLIDGTFTNLRYNFSWDWLIPVIQKIKNDGKASGPNHIEFLSWFDSMNYIIIDFDIEKAFQACIKYIKWYNDYDENVISV